MTPKGSTPHLYTGATPGGTDGTQVSEATGLASIALGTDIPDGSTGQAVAVCVRFPATYQSLGAVRITPYGTYAEWVQLSLDGTTWGMAGEFIDVVDCLPTNTPFYARAVVPDGASTGEYTDVDLLVEYTMTGLFSASSATLQGFMDSTNILVDYYTFTVEFTKEPAADYASHIGLKSASTGNPIAFTAAKDGTTVTFTTATAGSSNHTLTIAETMRDIDGCIIGAEYEQTFAVTSLPTFSVAPAAAYASATSETLTATHNGTSAYCEVVARGTVPDFSVTDTFTSPQTLSGLTNRTNYDAYILLENATGTTLSAPVPFTTGIIGVWNFEGASPMAGITFPAGTWVVSNVDDTSNSLRCSSAETQGSRGVVEIANATSFSATFRWRASINDMYVLGASYASGYERMLVISGGKFYAYSGSYPGTQQLRSCSQNTWYTIKMNVNTQTRKFTVTINDTLYDNAGAGFSLYGSTSVTGLALLGASYSGQSGAGCRFDDLTIRDES